MTDTIDIESLKRRLREFATATQQMVDAQVMEEAASVLELLQRELENERIERQTFQHGHRIASNRCADLERELDEARKTLEALTAQGSGIPGSTAKADCMASLAGLALRRMDAALQQKG